MAVFGDFFGDLFGEPESTVTTLARTLARQWGTGAMRWGPADAPESWDDPTDWGKFLLVRAGLMADIRSFAEGVYEQAFVDTAEHEIDHWDAIMGLPPAPADMLDGDRMDRLLAYSRAVMSALPAVIQEALESLAGVADTYILEHTALDCALDPEQIFIFWTLVSSTVWADEDIRGDINYIVSRWKPAHTQHGRRVDNPNGGVRVASAADPTTPAWFKTGVGPEKTSRNLIRLT